MSTTGIDSWIREHTIDSECVVEFGAMFFERLNAVHENCKLRVGIEAHLPYILIAERFGNCIRLHGDMREFESLLDPTYLDTAMFIDSLEHLSRENASDLIHRVMMRFRKILLFIPEGDHPQTKDVFLTGADYWQTHRSTWYKDDVIDLGFQDVCVVPNYYSEQGKDHGAIFAIWKRSC